MPDRSTTTPLDGAEFLEANRTNRAKYRAEAEEKAAKAERKAAKTADSTQAPNAPEAGDGEDVGDTGDDRVPRKLDAASSRSQAPRRRRLANALIVLSAVLALTTAFFAYSYFHERNTVTAAAQTDAQRTEVMNTAKEYAAELATYDASNYDDLDRRIGAISTQKFTETYIASSQQARQGNAEAKGVSRAESKEAGIQSLSDTKAVVLVTLDQTVTSSEVSAQVPDGIPYQSRVKVTLVRQDGKWLLDDLTTV